jgi:uncharacterized protein (DUF2147 family)
LKAKLPVLILAGIAAIAAAAPPAHAQGSPITGLWQKVEDGKTVGWFLFVERNGVAEGAIAKLFPTPGENPNPVCTKCTDDRKNAPLLGISLIRDMKREPQASREGQLYKDGNILDPRDGQIWRAQMTVSPDGKSLTLRGYVLVPTLGRSEVWQRLPDSAIKDLDRTVLAKYMPEQIPAARGGRPKAK